MTIAVVVPTIRYTTEYQKFLQAWEPLFHRYTVDLLTVQDGEEQIMYHRKYTSEGFVDYESMKPFEVLEGSQNLLMQYSPACRNLGFAYVAKALKDVDIILTLDDDVRPIYDPFNGHLDALGQQVSTSYFNTFWTGQYPRGFPYGSRYESEVVLSHGPWLGVADWDAPTQLVQGNVKVGFYTGPVPRGIDFSICGMNLAFKRKLLPYVYYAPVKMFKGAERFDDIWMGRHLKQYIDTNGMAIMTGYGPVLHERASDPFKNLVQEAVGIGINEDYWHHQHEPFFTEYRDMRNKWEALIKSWL